MPTVNSPSDGNLAGYQLLERIAKGGMAEVFRAKPPLEETRSADQPEIIALKRLLADHRADSGYVNLFLEEGKMCVRLNHPNVVKTYKVFKKGPDYFMVQEFVEGASLGRLLEFARNRERPLDLEASLQVAQGLLKALEYVHLTKRSDQGGGTIVHRDINPANVLCSKTGGVKLIDFGVAEAEGLSMIGSNGAIRGTLTYLAPEAVLGRSVDRRADLYATGILLWEMAANKLLFAGASDLEILHKIQESRTPLLSKIRKDLPELLIQIVRKALFADLNLRFQNAGDFLRALDALSIRSGLTGGDKALAKEVQAATSGGGPQLRA